MSVFYPILDIIVRKTPNSRRDNLTWYPAPTWIRKNRHSPPERVQRCRHGMIGTCWASCRYRRASVIRRRVDVSAARVPRGRGSIRAAAAGPVCRAAGEASSARCVSGEFGLEGDALREKRAFPDDMEAGAGDVQLYFLKLFVAAQPVSRALGANAGARQGHCRFDGGITSFIPAVH